MKVKQKSIIVALVVVLTLLAACGPTDVPVTSAPVQPSPTSVPETAIPGEITQLLEDYDAAFNAYDADAFQALVTEGYMAYRTEYDSHYAVSSGIAETSPVEWVIAGLKSYYPNLEFRIERRGQAIVSGDGPWLVSQVLFEEYNDPKYPNGIEGISTVTIVDEDGTLKVARDIFVALEVK
jgi:hypothetical protein